MGDWSAPPLPVGWATSGQPPFVARHEEVAALEAAWADVVGGAGRAVFVSGAPGSGKSRLVSEVCTRLHAEGAAVLAGACIQELGAPFEPFDEPLRALFPAFRERPVDASDASNVSSAADASLVESAHVLESVLDRTDRDAADRSTGQDRVFAAVVDVLRSAAATRPLVLAVEGTAGSRVLLLGTLRSTPPDRSDPLADTLASLARLRGVLRLELAPFTVAEITDYVAIRAGLPHNEAREAASVLNELTGGNPFFLRAMWRPVVEAEQQGDQRVIELPDSVGAMTLGALAVRFLVEVIGISEASVQVTLEAMDAAVRNGLIEPPRRAGDHYRFPHAIARQAVIDLVPSTEVLRIHAQIAQTLEADFPAAPRLVQRLAHHYTAARALGFGDRAVTYLSRAADLAVGRVAFEDAGRLFERAADISPDTAERAELLLRAAGSWDLEADTARARAIFEQVSLMGNPRQRVRGAIGFEDASWRPGLLGHRALEMLTTALASIPPDHRDPHRPLDAGGDDRG